jgi:hypothetical protein
MVTTPDPPPGAVRWPTDRNDRVSWQAALSSAKEGWRRAYERDEPTAGDAALVLLADAIGAAQRREDDAIAEAEREREARDRALYGPTPATSTAA